MHNSCPPQVSLTPSDLAHPPGNFLFLLAAFVAQTHEGCLALFICRVMLLLFISPADKLHIHICLALLAFLLLDKEVKNHGAEF